MATEAENDALQAALAERPEPTDVQVDELKRRLRIAERRADPTLHAHLTEALDTAEGLLAEKEALARRLEEVEASTTNQVRGEEEGLLLGGGVSLLTRTLHAHAHTQLLGRGAASGA